MTRKLSWLMQDIREALESEHGNCDNNSCDVSAAMREGLYLWAAHLLTGATECERTEKALIAYEKACKSLEKKREEERNTLCDLPSQECKECGSWIYDHESETCGNCLAPLPRYRWRVTFSAYCGMTTHDECGSWFIEDKDGEAFQEAREEAIALLRSRVRSGHTVARIVNGAHDIQWEVQIDAEALVPDTAGILAMTLESNVTSRKARS